MGKRQLGELQPSELVVTILISNLATLPIEETSVPLLGGVGPILLLVCFEVVISWISLKSRRARRLISGQPVTVVQHGKIVEDRLRDLRFSLDDLMEELRQNGIFDIRDVEFAVVETNGKLSVYQRYGARPITPDMLGMECPKNECPPPTMVISDGELLKGSLAACGLQPKWLEKQLHRHGLTVEEVFLMVCDRNAAYFLLPKEKTGKKAVDKK
ncbi:MAG: DUF421 domain-containing protein [Oscillospiraceae bacterium]|nr:DUF421 domain-containing protein [Oscillospiraceae bacterium]